MEYLARIGDSAGKIAQLFTGSPVNAPDLVRANPQKSARDVGGVLAFESLLPGERLSLPATWLRGSPGGPGVGAPVHRAEYPAGTYAEYPGAFGPRYGGSGGVWQSIWADQDHSLYPATGGASVYGQYYVISEGQLTLGALIVTAHPDQVIPPGFQSAALANANPRLRGVDPNVSLPAGTRVNVPERWVDSLQRAGYSVGNNMGVGQLPTNGAAAPAAPANANGAAAPAAAPATAPTPPGPVLPAVAPPGGSTHILCPDGSLAPGGDPKRCAAKVTEAPTDVHAVASAAKTIACPDGEPAPGGDEKLCPPPGAPKGAWNQNKHGKWSYEDPAFPGWIYPLEVGVWVERGARGEYADHAHVMSDGKLSINALLAKAGQSAAVNAAFFVANPNLRVVDPNAILPSGTVVYVPISWEHNLQQSGLTVNVPPVGVGYLGAPSAPSVDQQHLAAAAAVAAAPGASPLAPDLHPLAPHQATAAPIAAVHPLAPHQAAPAAPVAHPAAPRVQPHVTTGWVSAPSGHRWYRDPRWPGYGYDEGSRQWVPEAQLEQYAFASGGAVQADTAAQYGGYQQSLPYGYAQPPYVGAPVYDGWVQGPRGSWRYLDRQYPGYGYDWGLRRWMRHEELIRAYGG